MTSRQFALSDLCEIVSSKRVFAADYKDAGVPFYRGKEVSQLARGERVKAELFISEAVYEDAVSRTGKISAGDVLMTAVGTLGNVYRVKEDDQKFYFKDGNVIWLRNFRPFVNSSFLRHWLASPLGRKKVLSTAIGSTQAALTIAGLSQIQIQLPSSAKQQEIAEFLDTTDSLIRLNQGTASNLEQIAQTLFTSWFIDFDPVHAKSRGEEPEGMDAGTAALFPDSFEESELGLIPSGWKAGSVSDLCSKVVNGSTPSRGNRDFWALGDFPWFKTGELADNFLIDSSESISDMAVNQTSVKVLPRGSVLMAIYAAPTVGRLGILTSDAVFNQACTGMVPLEEVGSGFLYLKLKESRDYFNSLAIGAAQQNISKGVVENCPVIIPDLSVFAAFNQLVGPMLSMIERQTFQNANLASIRDALLPRLISGELEIPEELLVD